MGLAEFTEQGEKQKVGKPENFLIANTERNCIKLQSQHSLIHSK